jgi:hypothetical protein
MSGARFRGPLAKAARTAWLEELEVELDLEPELELEAGESDLPKGAEGLAEPFDARETPPADDEASSSVGAPAADEAAPDVPPEPELL